MASEALVSPDVRKGTQLYPHQAGWQECSDVAQEVRGHRGYTGRLEMPAQAELASCSDTS